MASKASQLAVYVETAPGLEEVAWIEVRRYFPQARFREFLFARDERGIAVFDVAATPSDLFVLRTATGIFLNGAFLANTTRGYRDLHQLREQIARSGDFGGAVNAYSRHRRRQVGSYRLIVRTYGKHEYNRQAVRRAVIQAVEGLYPEWQRAQEDPDLEIWANVLGSSILVGLRLPLPAARRRQPSATLPTAIAEALVVLSDPQPDDYFLDPFFDEGAVVAARSAYPANRLYAALESKRTPDMTQLPAEGQGPEPTFVSWRNTQLSLQDATVNKLATRFPLTPAAQTEERYVAWLQEIERVLQPGSGAVILTRAYEQFKDAIRHTPQLEIRGGYSVTVAGEWERIYLVQRLETDA